MSKEIYQEISQNVNSEFTEQKSKFIGLAFVVYSEEEIKTILNNLRGEHGNANHVCYAYRMGERYELYRFSDDGEPTGTAGRPIYGQIEAYNLTNILVAVVRYFGGIKLGTGGLVANYQKSAKLALESADVIEKEILQALDIVYDYDVTNDVQRIIHEMDILVVHTDYLDRCYAKITMGKNKIDLFQEKITNITGINLQ